MRDRSHVRDAATHADDRVRDRPASELGEVGRDRRERVAHDVFRHGAVEAEALGEPHRADVEAEALGDVRLAPECELRAAAARVEHDECAAANVQPCDGGGVGEARLLLARDHLDPDAAALAHGIAQCLAVRCGPQAGGADGRDRDRALAPRLVDHAGDRVCGSLHRLGTECATRGEPLAEPRHIGAVDDCPPLAGRAVLADVELDGVRPHVDDRVPCGLEADEGLQTARKAHVGS